MRSKDFLGATSFYLTNCTVAIKLEKRLNARHSPSGHCKQGTANIRAPRLEVIPIQVTEAIVLRH